MINYSICYFSKNFILKCQVLSKSPQEESALTNKSVYSHLAQKSAFKRSEYSSQQIANQNPKKSLLSNTSEMNSDSNDSLSNNSVLNQSNSNKQIILSNENESVTYTSLNENNIQSKNQKNILTSQMFQSAKHNSFPRKEFIIAGKLETYTPILNFFESVTVLENVPDDNQKSSSNAWVVKNMKVINLLEDLLV